MNKFKLTKLTTTNHLIIECFMYGEDLRHIKKEFGKHFTGKVNQWHIEEVGE